MGNHGFIQCYIIIYNRDGYYMFRHEKASNCIKQIKPVCSILKRKSTAYIAESRMEYTEHCFHVMLTTDSCPMQHLSIVDHFTMGNDALLIRKLHGVIKEVMYSETKRRGVNDFVDHNMQFQVTSTSLKFRKIQE